MKTVSALKFRQEFGKFLDQLKADGEGFVIEKNADPVAVIVPYQEFQRRFVDKFSADKRELLLKKFRDNRMQVSEDSTETLRRLRYGEDGVK